MGYVEDEAFRSIAYEIAMSEMFVPYQDPDPHWFYRAYFDMGEFGFGNMATELKGRTARLTPFIKMRFCEWRG